MSVLTDSKTILFGIQAILEIVVKTSTSYFVIYTCLCFFKYTRLVLKEKLYHCEKLAELYTLLTTLSTL